jgi:hypothetical protein
LPLAGLRTPAGVRALPRIRGTPPAPGLPLPGPYALELWRPFGL